MPIHDDFIELQNITIELKRLRTLVRDLGAKKRECEARILYYLEENNHPGLRMGDTIVTATEQKRSKRPSKIKQMNQGEEILRQYGISEPQTVLQRLFESIKGSPEQKQVLKINKIK